MTYQSPTWQPNPEPEQQRGSALPWILLALVLIPVIACVTLGVIALGGVSQTAGFVQNMLDGGQVVVRTERPAVITRVQELGRLETARYTVEKVIEGSVDQGNEFLNFFLGDRLLLIAHGEVIAGLDLSELTDDDITVDETRERVTLQLPPVRLLSHRLDNERSYVYDRRLGLLSRGDPNLETEVRREAERQIVLAACESGIIAQAADSAQRQLRLLLLAMDFQEVEVLPPQPAESSGCE